MLRGTAVAVGVGFLLGLLMDAPVSPETNALVAGRVVPIAFDIVVGLLTGIVAAVVLVRDDISNSVPGVAIAVTLISALAVAAILLESGEYAAAWDALVLFGANASATLAAGTLTMLACGVRASVGLTATTPDGQANPDDPRHVDRGPWSRTVTLATIAVVVAAPLALATVHLQREQSTHDTVQRVSLEWAGAHGVDFTGIDGSGERLTVSFEGPAPLPAPDALASALADEGVDTSRIEVRLVPVTTHRLGEGGAVPEP